MSHYCLLCGNQLSIKNYDGREREICQVCNWIYYPQLKVTAGVFVEEDKKLLLVQRAIEPWKELWYLPAGYVENDETPLKAAEREAIEETGLKIKAGELLDIFFYDDDPRGNGLLILYKGVIKGGEIKNNCEAQAVGFFLPKEVSLLKLAGGSHNRAILKWLNKQTMVTDS